MPENKVGSVVPVFLALFYADDGMIASTDADLLQEAMNSLAALFERVGLFTNVDKTLCLWSTPRSKSNSTMPAVSSVTTVQRTCLLTLSALNSTPNTECFNQGTSYAN